MLYYIIFTILCYTIRYYTLYYIKLFQGELVHGLGQAVVELPPAGPAASRAPEGGGAGIQQVNTY